VAFERKNLSRIGGSGFGNTVWMHSSTDAYATVQSADYFKPAITEMAKGDCVWVVDTATPTVYVTYVDAHSASAISTATGNAVTA